VVVENDVLEEDNVIADAQYCRRGDEGSREDARDSCVATSPLFIISSLQGRKGRELRFAIRYVVFMRVHVVNS